MSTFIVSEGEYSDYHIIGVFSTRENAEKYIKTYNRGYIEEYQFDKKIENIPDDHQLFKVHIHENGSIIDVSLNNKYDDEEYKILDWHTFINYDTLHHEQDKFKSAYLTILAKNDKHAKEIATEIYKNDLKL